MIDVPRDDLVLMMEAGYIYLSMGKFSEAKQVFEGIVALIPKNELPRVGLANVFFSQKKYLQAIRTLKEALKLNEKSAFALSHLGEAYLFYGKVEEARQALEQACTVNPQEEEEAVKFAESLLELMDQGYDPQKLKKEQKK